MAEEIYLTQAAHQALLDELAQRKGSTRDMIVKKVSAAREEGDLKENGGYHAARDEQGMNEARIREIEHIISIAEVGTPTDANADGKYEVTPGMLVEAKMSTLDRVLKFVLGARENAVDGVDAFSPSSPLGSAVLGKQEGDKVSYKAPSGREIEVTIISVQPSI